MNDSSKSEQKSPEGHAIIRPDEHPDQRLQHAHRAMRIILQAGFQARLAGGCVRDRILGVRPKDYDIASDAPPDSICTMFKQKGVKVVPTGIDHGTVTLVMAGQGIEVTTLRKDVTTDGRRAVVAFGTSYEEDAERRDFTMNAMFEDLEGKVYDYFHGIEDLRQGRLRFVGDPITRIREDYLRILRLFRFWARYGFTPDLPTLAAVAAEREGLRIISQERITSELLALLGEEDCLPAVASMAETGVLPLILDNRGQTFKVESVAAYKSITKTERAVCRLAALLGASWRGEGFQAYLLSLRLSKQQIQQILSLQELPELDMAASRADLMVYLDQLEKVWGVAGLLGAALPALRLQHAEAGELLQQLETTESLWGDRRRAALPLSGKELMERLALAPGPVLGELVAQLLRSFRNGEWSGAEEGLREAKRLLAKGVQPKPFIRT